ncbi:MAG: glutamine-hydrolyzing GMP synthase [Candidatus Caldarchaeum sp.]|nr:glutamine-hydrolyzing GMP synthase [Candidatus Caldarchaeum sp.]
MEDDVIAVIDFGGQYTHLISRRIRSLGVKTAVIPSRQLRPAELKTVKGVIFSGGPASVYEEDAPRVGIELLEGRPVLGICYGHQLLAHLFGGEVEKARVREYGRTVIQVDEGCRLFKGLPNRFMVWMSHSDHVKQLPPGFTACASTSSSTYAAICNEGKQLYGVQFHPEVSHTENGIQILANFVFNICGCIPSWKMENYVDRVVQEIAQQVGDGRVLCAVSGGIDSTVTAALVSKAVGKKLKCIFINHGLLRKKEPEQVLEALKNIVGEENVVYVDASKRFLEKLRGVADPEEKRKIIGHEFAAVFEEYSRKHGPFTHLAQGTLYPDVVESGRSVGGSAVIKTHHNVGGMPETFNLELVEPLKELYKDEVRQIAELLGLPKWLVKRHPFPGPGLAVRVIGEVTEEKLRICRDASAIVEEELEKMGLLDDVWQAFAVVGDDKATGVKGDVRSLGHVVTVRVVSSVDGMTADYVKIPYETLDRIASRITNEVEGVSWVTYAISSKPPATIEPQ